MLMLVRFSAIVLLGCATTSTSEAAVGQRVRISLGTLPLAKVVERCAR